MFILFIGALIITLLLTYEMFGHAIIMVIVVLTALEIWEFKHRQKERESLKCSDCSHFIAGKDWKRPDLIGYCCHKQLEICKDKACPEYLVEGMKVS